ncbi:hypothetical protein ANN_04722 [Periplaneta americana]|uniref:Reverse transcriptase domain-containing protein n=1 Tax=Periplaneta americana TaxID=6978 RepID=A0ABQ8TB95_PERAM|nr:hypothetical protein ANN_04722 [Periplaneta americana]
MELAHSPNGEANHGLPQSAIHRGTVNVLQRFHAFKNRPDQVNRRIYTQERANKPKVTTEDTKLYLYADDIVMLSNNKVLLQKALNKLEEWSQTNNLNINQNKTKTMKFRKGGKLSSKDTFTCGNRTLEIVKLYKYSTYRLLDSNSRDISSTEQLL